MLFCWMLRIHPPAPCGATRMYYGSKDKADIRKLASVQTELLGNAIRLPCPGETIIFSNCSLTPAEGDELVRKLSGRFKMWYWCRFYHGKCRGLNV